MSNRRMEALRAMAEQDASPTERDIARDKLAKAEAAEAWEASLLPPAEVRRRADQRDRELTRAAAEATFAELVKRWERGEFAGVRIRTGATTKIRFGRG